MQPWELACTRTGTRTRVTSCRRRVVHSPTSLCRRRCTASPAARSARSPAWHIGTALGFSNWGTVALAVALAFLFGYSLTSLPLLRAGFALAAVIPIAFASDTFSITVMEIVDNAIVVVVPGALEA